MLSPHHYQVTHLYHISLNLSVIINNILPFDNNPPFIHIHVANLILQLFTF